MKRAPWQNELLLFGIIPPDAENQRRHRKNQASLQSREPSRRDMPTRAAILRSAHGVTTSECCASEERLTDCSARGATRHSSKPGDSKRALATTVLFSRHYL